MNTNETNGILEVAGAVFYHFWWIILPVLFYYIFKIIYKDFVAVHSPNSWLKTPKWTMLEIIPPKTIEKGPKMMESFFAGISGVLTTFNTFDEFLQGKLWHDRFSLELVSEEGKIHFYIRTKVEHRNLVEAHIYAQYPEAEIIEVEDYYNRFPKVIPNKRWDLWGTDFEFVLANAYSIKTYDKFEETISGEMNDPMAAIAEVFGSLGPGQHAWIQFVVQPIPEGWKREKPQQEVINKLTGRGPAQELGISDHLGDVFGNITTGIFGGEMKFKTAEKKEQQPLEFRLTPMEKEILKATEDKLGRNCFKTKMRFILLGKRENFDKAKVSAVVGSIKQFNDINANQVKPEDITKTYGKIFFTKTKADFRKRKIYARYGSRNMDGPNLILSTKELATLFHFPDIGVKSPAVPRVASKLGSAPPNLPIE